MEETGTEGLMNLMRFWPLVVVPLAAWAPPPTGVAAMVPTPPRWGMSGVPPREPVAPLP